MRLMHLSKFSRLLREQTTGAMRPPGMPGARHRFALRRGCARAGGLATTLDSRGDAPAPQNQAFGFVSATLRSLRFSGEMPE